MGSDHKEQVRKNADSDDPTQLLVEYVFVINGVLADFKKVSEKVHAALPDEEITSNWRLIPVAVPTTAESPAEILYRAQGLAMEAQSLVKVVRETCEEWAEGLESQGDQEDSVIEQASDFVVEVQTLEDDLERCAGACSLDFPPSFPDSNQS